MLGGKDNPIMGEALPPLALGQVWRTLGRWIDLRNESNAPQTGQEDYPRTTFQSPQQSKIPHRTFDILKQTKGRKTCGLRRSNAWRNG